MKSNRVLIALGLIALIAYMRWPRFEKDRIYVTDLQLQAAGMHVEYRASQPFSLAIEHGTRLPLGPPTSSGPSLRSWTPIQTQFYYFDASYDYLRGEYFASVRYGQSKSNVVIECNGQTVTLQPLIPNTMGAVKWDHARPGASYNDGGCVDLYLLNVLPNVEEFLMVYVGSEVRKTNR